MTSTSLTSAWHNNPVFLELCDIVASDRLVCVTGAGISGTLRHAKSSRKKLPQWRPLLKTLQKQLRHLLADDEKREVARLLREGTSNEELIEAATLLWRGREEKFDKLLRAAVTHKSRDTSDTHRALLELHPRGILTFNYDLAHENSFPRQRSKEKWNVILPWQEDKLRGALESRCESPFLLKAHGSLKDKEHPLVLTYEAYRELLVKHPLYRTFVQNLLINFNLLIVGFGLSDPDFDQFIESLSAQVGAPLRTHIVIRHKDQTAKENYLRLRFGIRTLYIDDFQHIPDVIRDAIRRTGPVLDKTIEKCLDSEKKTRTQGHDELSQLGRAGRERASHVLRARIDTYSNNINKLSEIAYSLGELNPAEARNKQALCRIVEESKYVEPVAHALMALQSALEVKDLRWLEEQFGRIKNNRLKHNAREPDPDNRLPAYLEFLILYVRAKHKRFPVRSTTS